MACKAYRYGLDAGDAHGPCMCSCHSKKAHGSEAVEHGVQRTVEACPDDRHGYYLALLDYVYCPYCGERLLSR